MNRARQLLPCLVIAVVGLLAYRNTLRNGFVWDDHSLVEDNRFLRSWRFAPRLFVTDINDGSESGPTTMYRPVWMLSQLADYQWFGPRPGAFHLLNLVWHVGTAWLLYAVLRRLEIRRALALAGALVFVAHPVHTETVSFVVGRCAVMSAGFSLVALWAVLRLLDRPPPRSAAAAALVLASTSAFALALFAKESAVTWPALIAAAWWLWSPRRRIPPPTTDDDLNRHRQGRVLVALAIGYGLVLVTFFSLRQLALTYHAYPSPTAWPDRLPLALRALAGYLALAAWPHNLHLDRALPGDGGSAGAVALGGALLLALLVGIGCWYHRRDTRVTFGLVFFALAAALTSNLVPIQPPFAERWLYGPLIGLLIALTAALDSTLPRAPKTTVLVSLGAALLVAFLAGRTFRQNRIWRNDRTLFEAMLARGADSPRFWTTLGILDLNEGRDDLGERRLQQALARNPTDPAALNARGVWLVRQQRPAAARTWFRAVLRVRPGDARAAQSLAQLDEREGNLPAAEAVLRRAAAAASGFQPSLNLAQFYYHQRRWSDAEQILRRVLTADPLHAMAHNLLGAVLLRTDRLAAAAEQFHLALRYDRWLFEAHANLAAVAEQQGRLPAAVEQFDQALRLAPQNADLYCALGRLLARHGQVAPARTALQHALELEPDYPEARQALAALPPATPAP